ncbi:MAG TPA: M1 family aminopeptidase [Candidatus Eisenbacteria bacterium]|nr:M1 family aminopeptidase [Candidatus Eisenbacteria bacterium]
MLLQIAWFEIGYWFRSWMLWIFTLIIAAMIFGAVSTDQITVGGALTNTFHNAPYVIQNYYSFIGLLTLLMVTAFVNSAASRDFSHNTYQIIFSTPLKRRDFILGRFIGSTLISVIPMTGVSIGILLARYMPWVDPERWGPVIWSAHLKGILLFAIPNTLFIAAILFTVALLARNDIVAFVGGLLLITGYAVAAALTQNLERERLAGLLDPFAIRTFGLVTKYWTVADKNTISVGFSGLLLWNRLLWIAVGLAVFAFGYFRFSFAERSRRSKAAAEADSLPSTLSAASPSFQLRHDDWAKFLASVKIHFLGILRSTVFVIIVCAALLNSVPSIIFSAREGYGNSTLPVTCWILDIIASTLYMFILVIITYYAGVLVWKDRDTHIDEIADSLPAPEWVSFLSRFVSLGLMVMLIQFLALLSGVIVQAAYGYHRFQFGLYLSTLFGRDLLLFVMFGALAFFIHALSPNKYVGYFAYIAFIIVNFFVWSPLNVSTNLVQFASTPQVVHSDMFGDAPYITAWRWYALYWILFCCLLSIATVMFWPRGKQSVWPDRFRNASLRFRGIWPRLAAACLVLFAAIGGWIYYNTEILNHTLGPKDRQRLQADYEKEYKSFDKLPMPRVRGIRYAIDIYPSTRNAVMRGEEVIYNPFSQPLGELHLSLDHDYDTETDVPGATLVKDDKRLFYRIYRFSPPLASGQSITFHFTVKSHNRGFENSVSNVSITQNGTFFNSTIGPIVGYSADRELTDPVERKKFGLGEQHLMKPLERNCTADCSENYLRGHSDWVDVETIISTSPDQIAIAPGSLLREWRENGRRYFDYKLDHTSLNFFSFMSARYAVQREEWNGIQLEVYYDPDHYWNVPRMMNSMKKALTYYTTNFGPYYHKEARIIEFPRVASFAQAFAGTMPYSESIGFIANLNHPDDIDMVFYVVAHEMGHQWWAHQVVGADMDGATLLSETMAQYSALMVMEKEYGRDIMRKFLKYEMDNYLRSRGQERLKERPLLTVEAEQGYIHYRKGSVILYYLKEMIGEDKVNAALRSMIQRYAYAPPPYPTSWNLVDALQQETPPQYQYLIKDLFEDITLFSNRTLDATARKRPDGKYDVTINVESHKFKDDPKGNETEVSVDDWMDIGAFAKPPKDRKYGQTLFRELVHVTQSHSTYTFVTDQLPDKAGIDPFLLLIDRVPDDNTKTVSLLAGTSTAD